MNALESSLECKLSLPRSWRSFSLLMRQSNEREVGFLGEMDGLQPFQVQQLTVVDEISPEGEIDGGA